MSLFVFMNAGGLHGLAKIVSFPPAVAIACLMKGMRYCLSCATLNDFSALSPSSTYV